MCVRREHVLAMRVRQIDQYPAQPVRPLDEREDHLPLLHPVHRHVDVVAGPRGVQPACGILPAGPDDQPLDEEKEIFTLAVVTRLPHFVERDAVERAPDRPPLAPGDDSTFHEHHQVGVVNGHQRDQELRLRILEVFVEHAADVFRVEAHVSRAYRFPRLRRFASRRYAPSVPAGNWRQRPRPM
jgi:hypothetical protein